MKICHTTANFPLCSLPAPEKKSYSVPLKQPRPLYTPSNHKLFFMFRRPNTKHTYDQSNLLVKPNYRSMEIKTDCLAFRSSANGQDHHCKNVPGSALLQLRPAFDAFADSGSGILLFKRSKRINGGI
jgi:hypothetical protein